jgi:hypothetical protein
MPDPSSVYAVMAAVMGGLAVTFIALLTGDFVVRKLKLPRDLPEGPRFEPPPPAGHGVDRVAATVIAQKQKRLISIHAAAFGVLRISQQAHDLFSHIEPMARSAAPDQKQKLFRAAVVIERASTQAAESAAAAEQDMRNADPDIAERLVQEHAVRAAALLTEARQAASAFPEPADRRRVLILSAIALVALVWLLVLIITIAKRGS